MYGGKNERHYVYEPIHKGKIIALALIMMTTLVLIATCAENPKNAAVSDGGAGGIAADEKAACEKGETEVQTERKERQIACITYTKTNGMIYNEDFTAVITPSCISYARFFCENGSDGDYIELSGAAIESEKWKQLEEALWAVLPYLEEKEQEKSRGIFGGILKKLGDSRTDGSDESSFCVLWKLSDGTEKKAEYSTTDESRLLPVIQIMSESVWAVAAAAEVGTAE